jgi:Zn-dependent protease
MTFIVVLIGWLFSLCLHEFSHALVAYYGGDWTVREKGYLTFNPLRYTHPVYSLLLPMIFLLLGGIGLPGGAVYIETWRLRDRNWRAAVSLAGPASNLILAVILALILRFAPVTFSGFWTGLAFLALLQVTAVVLNLIPVPPFDGYNAIEPYLPGDIQMKIAPIRGMFIWIVILVLWNVPFVSNMFWSLIFFISESIGLPMTLAAMGLDAFFFWR